MREENEKVRLEEVYYYEQGKMLNRSVNEGSSGVGCWGNVVGGGGGVVGDSSSGNNSGNSSGGSGYQH